MRTYESRYCLVFSLTIVFRRLFLLPQTILITHQLSLPTLYHWTIRPKQGSEIRVCMLGVTEAKVPPYYCPQLPSHYKKLKISINVRWYTSSLDAIAFNFFLHCFSTHKNVFFFFANHCPQKFFVLNDPHTTVSLAKTKKSGDHSQTLLIRLLSYLSLY